jgi:hypothetical protein
VTGALPELSWQKMVAAIGVRSTWGNKRLNFQYK